VLRQRDGSPDPQSAGTWVAVGGDASHLALDEVELTVTDYWNSEQGGRYPSGWRIRIPSRNVQLSVKPVLANQELVTNVRYWEGAVDVTGTSGGVPIDGRGYVELTGYASD
jgi:predicted secreted hydrolase